MKQKFKCDVCGKEDWSFERSFAYQIGKTKHIGFNYGLGTFCNDCKVEQKG